MSVVAGRLLVLVRIWDIIFFSNIDTSFHDRGPKFVIFVKKNLNGIVFVSRLYAPLPPFVRTMRGPGRGSLTIFQRLVLVLRVPYV